MLATFSETCALTSRKHVVKKEYKRSKMIKKTCFSSATPVFLRVFASKLLISDGT